MKLPLTVDTWRRKLISEQIYDEAYRAWLLENMDEISLHDFIRLVMAAAMPIQEKADYLNLMLQDPELVQGTDLERVKYITDDIKEHLDVITAALHLISPDYNETKIMFELTQKWFDRDDSFLCYREYSVPHKTFQQAVDAIRQEYAYDFENHILPDDFHPDEFTWQWSIITCYQEEDDFKAVIKYVVGEDGTIWNIQPYSDSMMDERFQRYGNDMGDLDLPTPFQPGDIVTVDCRPFHEIAHAVVIYRHDFPEDCCSPGCLALIDDEWTLHSVKHFFIGDEEFSPLLRIGVYHGELPENEKLIGAVSRFIKTHPDGAELIDQWQLEHEPTEEALYQFMADVETEKNKE